MIAGSDIENGLASSLTERLSCLAQPREQRTPRRVGERGKCRSSVWLLIVNHMVKYMERRGDVKRRATFIFR